MSQQYPPEGWPYGASYYPGMEDGGQEPRQQQAPQVPPQATTASYPYTGQFTTPVGMPAAPAPSMPFPYTAYTVPPGVTPPGAAPPGPGAAPGAPPFVEQSYIENILRLNLGKTVTVYATFEGAAEWKSLKVTGTLEAAGRDHVIVEDEETRVRYLIPMVFVNYFTFVGPLDYFYPFAAQPTTQPGR
ncbi:spore coat protein GerQ [Sporolactobacillus sp. THM7-7]|nr:spore coat protein GerQ [Sporolactobacillus sp. THM7-7]